MLPAFQCVQPVHLISRRKHICRLCAACGLALTLPPSGLPTANTTFFFTLLSSSGLSPSPALPENKVEWLWSLCPFLAVHLRAKLALPLSFRVPPGGSPCPWARYRGAPSLSLALLPSLHFPNCASSGTSSVYSPGSPEVLYPHHSFLSFSPLSIVCKYTKLSSPFCGRHFSLSACFPFGSRPTFLPAF